MSGLFNKMLNFVGLEAEEEYEEEYEENEEEKIELAEKEEIIHSARRNKVVNIHSNSQMKVVVLAPESFEDAKDIVDHLKQKKPVIINLEELEKDLAKKIVFFLSGAVYGIDGNIQKVSNGIFLAVPKSVDIMGDFREEFKKKESFA